MPWKITQQDGKFCVVKKEDGKVVKCHPTRGKARSHLTALYVNEPSAAKKSLGYSLLKSAIEERVVEIKACGANKPGGGGFSAGNTCARGGGKTGLPIDHRELGKQGIFVKPEGSPKYFKVGSPIDFYDSQGNKKYGVIRKLSEESISIQSANSSGTFGGRTHKLKLRTEKQLTG